MVPTGLEGLLAWLSGFGCCRRAQGERSEPCADAGGFCSTKPGAPIGAFPKGPGACRSERTKDQGQLEVLAFGLAILCRCATEDSTAPVASLPWCRFVSAQQETQAQPFLSLLVVLAATLPRVIPASWLSAGEADASAPRSLGRIKPKQTRGRNALGWRPRSATWSRQRAERI